MNDKDTLFPKIGAVANTTAELNTDDTTNDDKPTQEIESLCMKCGEQGVTRLLLTNIPFFKEVVVMSFRCEHCGAHNNEIQSAGTIRPEGTVYTTRILDRSDLNRQIVRSATCEIIIPELELTLPSSDRGQLTTVEGLIRDVVADLLPEQALRRIETPAAYEKIQALLDKLTTILGDHDDDEVQVGKAAELDTPMVPFTLKLDDPSGNSFIEFIGKEGRADPKWNLRTYARSLKQNIALGLVSADEKPAAADPSQLASNPITNEEIFTFPGPCSSCGHHISTLMKKVKIPYFQDIIIMSTNCEFCGYRDNEVKSGSAISPQGKRITLKVEDAEDLSRDILKSDSAGMTIPEIDLVLDHGTLGGRFTTLEGILDQVYEELSEKLFGDSASVKDHDAFEAFLQNLKDIKSASRPFTLILDDPLANSYVQNLYAPDPDPNMTVEMYDRSWEDNEALGLNDIKVENYEAPSDVDKTDKTDAQLVTHTTS